MKKFKHGLVLGKWLPLHSGHVFLIEEGLKLCENLTILVCSLEREKIPGYLRYNWMKVKFPNANVIHITDEVPQSPETCDEGTEAFWKIWTKLIKDNTPDDLDVVITSEEYGDDISERLNIRHACVDKLRITFPISGTEIRTNPIENWDMIPDEVRHFFVKKVVLMGPESVGKTTLSEKLAKHYNTSWVPEYGRHYTEWTTPAHKLTKMDFSYIGAGQLQWEDEYAKKSNKVMICDTELMTTQIFAEMYVGESPIWLIRESWDHKYDLYFLLDIDVPWVDDGSREFPHLRQSHFDRIKKELDTRKIKYVIIRGSYEERFKTAIKEIDKLLKKMT